MMREEDDVAFVQRMNNRNRFAYSSSEDRERLCALALTGANRTMVEPAFKSALRSLIGAVSLLRRGGKEGSSSETMFNYRLTEYDRHIEVGQTVLKHLDEQDQRQPR